MHKREQTNNTSEEYAPAKANESARYINPALGGTVCKARLKKATGGETQFRPPHRRRNGGLILKRKKEAGKGKGKKEEEEGRKTNNSLRSISEFSTLYDAMMSGLLASFALVLIPRELTLHLLSLRQTPHADRPENRENSEKGTRD